MILMAAMSVYAGNVDGFEKGWRFIQQDVTLDQTAHTEEWRVVDLPHDWSIEGEFSRANPTGQGGWLPAGIGWYVKEFDYEPEENSRRVFLEFDGVMSHSTVFVNGREVGSRANGYASFCYDISEYVIKGNNRVAVKVDNSVQPASRWYTGCGINRHVRLVLKSDVYIPYNGVYCYSDDEYLHFVVTVCNSSSKKRKVSVRAGVAGSADVTLNAGESGTVRLDVEGRNVGLWDIDGLPADISKVDVELLGKGKVIDSESVNAGFRTIRLDNETGFWLNGRNVKMKGVCLHSDAGALGTVSAENVWRSRLLTLKELGVNAIRWAHNAPDPMLLNLCDSLGFLVMVESFDTWEAAKPHAEKGYNLDFNDNWRQDTEDLVKMARNHPCVMIYSVGNEIRDNLNSEDGFRKYRQQQDLIHELDPTRPVTMALFRPNSSGVYRNGFAGMMDVVGQNYRIEELKAYHEAHPEKVIIGTENTPDIESWLMLRDDPSLCGQFLWTGIEYLGEAEWPQVSWTTSLVDITGMVKPLGMQRKSWWTTEPMVAFARREGRELVSDWTPTDTVGVQDIEVYSNCSEVELILNGRSLGRQTMPADARPARYRVKFEPGELLIAGYAEKGGKVASERICTAGQPYALKLVSDSYNDAVFRAYVVDRDGNVCPNDIVPVTFKTTGNARILATDNADPMDHVNHQQPVRDTWRGSCVAYVDGFDANSTITVSAPGLRSGSAVSAFRGLNREEADKVRTEVSTEWFNRAKAATDYIAEQNAVVLDSLRMPLHISVYGELPEGGHSLYISLHGGGSAPKELNDSQWRNQWNLYRPKEGVYICPRAPYDDWNMHFKNGLDEFYKQIILFAYTHLDVNPDRVYLLGYSAGGDGVWRLAPQMADTWAAASMMAGHPGDVSLLNLLNLPFMVWCGAFDDAYDRNRECTKRIAELDSLQNASDGGYVHEGHIVEGKSHWMDQADTLAIDWMAKYTRNPYPKQIVWCQEEILHDSFYWIIVPKEEMERGREVRLSVEGNVINIEKCDYSSVTLCLNDSIANLDKPVRVLYRHALILHEGKLKRTRAAMERTLHERSDARYIFDCELTVNIPQ